MNNQSVINGLTPGDLPSQSVGENIQKWVYEYNVKGLMSSRQDSLLMQKENFTYDNLDRLTNVNQQVIIPPRLYNVNSSISYDNQGNIQNKTDIGAYSYDNTKPNAISSITEPAPSLPSLFQPLTHNLNTETQDIQYNLHNKIEKITQGNKELKFYYNSSQARIKAEYKENNIIQKTTYYIGNYECEVYPNGRIRELNYINTNTGHTIINLKDNNNNTPTDSLYYIFKDHLGSYDRITNQLGQIVETYSFDAWGNRRNPNSWRGAPTATQIENYKFTRGFTGHEHMDKFQLINMNGRLYDPVIARFLSPDPYVASNTFTQDYNRYSYCRNNPLLYTDPSGEFIWLIPNIGWSKNGGLSVGLTFMVGIPGVASAQVGIGYSFKSNDFNTSVGATAAFNTLYANYSTQSGFSTGWSAGLSPQMGFPISTNFTSVGVNYNITHDSWSGNISAWGVDNNGWTFNPSVSVMIYPEHTTNLVRGQGFRSNDAVLSRFVANGQQQRALNYFGFKGTYDPENKLFKKHGEHPAITDPKTGEIFYHNYPFEGNYDRLAFVANHEMRHMYNVLSGKYKGVEITNEIAALEEVDAYMYNYKNQGLYLKHGVDIFSRIKYYEWQSYNDNISIKWWHLIYKIPRLW